MVKPSKEFEKKLELYIKLIEENCRVLLLCQIHLMRWSVRL